MKAHFSTLRPSLTSMLVAAEPKSSFGGFFGGRGKKLYTETEEKES